MGEYFATGVYPTTRFVFLYCLFAVFEAYLRRLHSTSGVKSGTLNLQHSYKYRPLDDYLIERGHWSRDKELLLERAGLQGLANPRTVLDNLDETLHAQYLTTNRNIIDSKNSFITFGQKGVFSLTTPTQEESEAEPLQNFFPERHYVPLLEVLATVNRYSSFLDEFQHWQQRHRRGRPSPKTFYAGLIGIGCTIGSRKMARISHSINESELEHTINWYFSVDNTHAAKPPKLAA
jgi:Tn3 transposase DDE domain